ncbi:DUF998 domain-containing protein [Streptomyces mangrovisoli]|uniref:DUF998 domain-containing protein n=1 Tax=Streptomyces mangrovisoli TaxID=1428628 RepID=A0A1J4NK44_9ACTN|nr:DUF998 domain-containing protein [Streptomyces mangrovisoli]OIJ62753.1 hypothetical protein WN71_037725 [Streptomyces mangrovisoli]
MSDPVAVSAAPHTPPLRTARIRRWAAVVVAANIAFVASWLLAASWQGARYSVTAHTISDMYAEHAPGGAFLVVVITLCGAATLLFVRLSVWPALRAAGRPALVGTILLATSIYGLGDLLTPFEREACRQADAGCSASDQLANAGGTLDNVLSTAGVFSLIAAGFFLAAAMRRLPAWQDWARPTRWVATGLFALLLLDGLSNAVELDGLAERLLAAAGAAAFCALAVGIRRRTAGTR